MRRNDISWREKVELIQRVLSTPIEVSLSPWEISDLHLQASTLGTIFYSKDTKGRSLEQCIEHARIGELAELVLFNRFAQFALDTVSNVEAATDQYDWDILVEGIKIDSKVVPYADRSVIGFKKSAINNSIQNYAFYDLIVAVMFSPDEKILYPWKLIDSKVWSHWDLWCDSTIRKDEIMLKSKATTLGYVTNLCEFPK